MLKLLIFLFFSSSCLMFSLFIFLVYVDTTGNSHFCSYYPVCFSQLFWIYHCEYYVLLNKMWNISFLWILLNTWLCLIITVNFHLKILIYSLIRSRVSKAGPPYHCNGQHLGICWKCKFLTLPQSYWLRNSEVDPRNSFLSRLQIILMHTYL